MLEPCSKRTEPLRRTPSSSAILPQHFSLSFVLVQQDALQVPLWRLGSHLKLQR